MARRKGQQAASRTASNSTRSEHASAPASTAISPTIAILLIALVGAAGAVLWSGVLTPRTLHPELRAIALRLIEPGKGILAADESPDTFGKRLQALPNKPGIRRQWRKILLTANGLEQYVSGVILHDESRTQLANGPEWTGVLSKGVALGLKLDMGLEPMADEHPESYTKGLEGLFGRCEAGRRDGMAFAKWRSVFRVDASRGLPSAEAVARNARDMAAYAAETLRCGLVPILEPEVLADGGHSMAEAAAAAERVLRGVYDAVRANRHVDVSATLLKAAFVTPGLSSQQEASPEQVANATLTVLLRTVPPSVPGVVFLSGGLSEEAASANLAAVSRMAQDLRTRGTPVPWPLSFSFGRALQASGLAAWSRGDPAGAQAAVLARARANSLAQQGLGEP